ncbi:hypothetical protein HYPSUDRAFT_957260 [Hypholoma sublateritium FD-334 SS-4]|uniref:Uncharacterized protein n=1 Tax=Hypholoma sublateritium (strain FD-334 SS-4) TaxID=945553 RepID=A0A0D2PDW3_HYPSF|nr:hypothetical protein HYPSUDRAFT_957260 [Hypholoma sublateritium FD-334 SS-4]
MSAARYNRLPSAFPFLSLLLVPRRISVQRPSGRAPSAIGCLVCRTTPISLHVSLCRECFSPRITRPLSSYICPAVFFSRLLITQFLSFVYSRSIVVARRFSSSCISVTISAPRFECIPILILDIPAEGKLTDK